MKSTCFTPKAMLDKLETMRAHRPEIETLTYILGRDRILEWAHSVGVATESQLRDLSPPVPPLELRSIVAAPSEAVFLWSGLKDAEMCASFAERHFQHKGQEVIRMLDFGCGCGRTTRFLQGIGGFQVHGTDVNGRLVEWCQHNLDRVTTTRNEPAPPLNAATAQYDFVFSLSMFYPPAGNIDAGLAG